MSGRPLPRLLVAVRPRDTVSEALDRRLPSTAWSYVSDSTPAEWAEVTALLVGSVARELGDFHVSSTPRLSFVQTVYTGLDSFPFDRFPPPIQVAGNVGGYAPFVAERAVALALAGAHALLPSQRMVADGRLRPPPEERSLRGATALILGYGAIGQELAARLRPFGARIVGLNRSGRAAAGADAMYPAAGLLAALPAADFVFDARPLNRATRGSIGAAELRAMGPRAIYVNVGRAGTVVEDALYEHLRSHPDFRAALDPWWDEDFVTGRFAVRHPWTSLENFVGTPHSAGTAEGADRYALDRAIDNLARFFAEGRADHVANPTDY